MKIFMMIFRNKTKFMILSILMFASLIFYSKIHNLAYHTFGDKYRLLANHNNSLASLISKNSRTDENKSSVIEKDYDEEFDWPLYGNISILMNQLESGENPSITPFKNHDHSYLIANIKSCTSGIFGMDLLRKFLPSKWISYLLTNVTNPYLLIIVKSAVQNFEQRNIIRRIWGNDTARSKPFQTKTMFILGSSRNSTIQDEILKENSKYYDLIQVDVIENYYNISHKTLMGLRWAYENCINANYFLFIDNDYYLSVKNLLLFLRNPSKYEEYANKHKDDAALNRTDLYFEVTQNESVLMKDKELFAGHACPSCKTIRNGKWKVSIEEYSYRFYPKFINAGAYVMSRHTMKTMYFASHFVKRFIFDDAYYGIVAKKSGIKLFNSTHFLNDPKLFLASDKKFVIAAHLMGNFDKVENVWKEQIKVGNA